MHERQAADDAFAKIKPIMPDTSPNKNKAPSDFKNVFFSLALLSSLCFIKTGYTAFIKKVGITSDTSKILYGNPYTATDSVLFSPSHTGSFMMEIKIESALKLT